MIGRKAATFITLAAVSATVLGLFQNCSRAQLERPAEVFTLASKGATSWCLKDALSGYTVESYYVKNINVIPWIGSFAVDSDADGVPDSVESALGFDPVNPRSRSGALDRVCYDSGNNSANCPSVPNGCDSSPNALGFSQCDIVALDLDMIYQHPVQGLDTDKDGMPDYFELLSGISARLYDSAQDPDHDHLLNQEELLRGSNPFFSDDGLSPAMLMQVHAQKVTGSEADACDGEAWSFTIDHVQYAKTKAFSSTETSGVGISHVEGQNIVVAMVKLRPKSGTAGNARVYYQTILIDPKTEDLSLDSGQFQDAGEVLP